MESFVYEGDTGSKYLSEPPLKKSCINNCSCSSGNEGLLTNKEVKKTSKTEILRTETLRLEAAKLLSPTGGSLLLVR